MTTPQRRTNGVTKLLLVSAMVALVATPAAAAEMLLVCASDRDPGTRFDVKVNFERSTLTYRFRGGSFTCRATITADHIEFRGGPLITRINRVSGEYTAQNAAGGLNDIGMCRKMTGRVID